MKIYTRISVSTPSAECRLRYDTKIWKEKKKRILLARLGLPWRHLIGTGKYLFGLWFGIYFGYSLTFGIRLHPSCWCFLLVPPHHSCRIKQFERWHAHTSISVDRIVDDVNKGTKRQTTDGRRQTVYISRTNILNKLFVKFLFVCSPRFHLDFQHINTFVQFIRRYRATSAVAATAEMFHIYSDQTLPCHLLSFSLFRWSSLHFKLFSTASHVPIVIYYNVWGLLELPALWRACTANITCDHSFSSLPFRLYLGVTICVWWRHRRRQWRWSMYLQCEWMKRCHSVYGWLPLLQLPVGEARALSHRHLPYRWYTFGTFCLVMCERRRRPRCSSYAKTYLFYVNDARGDVCYEFLLVVRFNSMLPEHTRMTCMACMRYGKLLKYSRIASTRYGALKIFLLPFQPRLVLSFFCPPARLWLERRRFRRHGCWIRLCSFGRL